MSSSIALLTDFGTKDHYAGVLKGVIAQINPQCRVIDINHGITPQNIAEGAWSLYQAYSYFPQGTVFVTIVDPGVGTKRRILCVRTQNFYFIAPDNGLLDPTLRIEKPKEIRSITNSDYFLNHQISSTFHGRDVMAPCAAHLIKNQKIYDKLGPRIHRITPLPFEEASTGKHQIKGTVLYFDYYGNAFTNVKKSFLSDPGWDSAEISIKSKKIRLFPSYGYSQKKFAAVWNSSGHLELAVPGGSIQKELKLKVGEKFKIQFYEK